jgi:hypothetical protein
MEQAVRNGSSQCHCGHGAFNYRTGNRRGAGWFCEPPHGWRLSASFDSHKLIRSGVLGDYMPQGFARQQMLPFAWREKDGTGR